MVLEKQVIDIPFGGLETKTAKELVQPGQMLDLRNCDFRQPGAISKRNGMENAGSITYTVQQLMVSRNNLFVAASPLADGQDAQVLTRNEASAATSWQRDDFFTGSYLPMQVYEKEIAQPQSQEIIQTVLTQDAAVVGNYLFVGGLRLNIAGTAGVRSAGGYPFATVVDRVSGAVIFVEFVLPVIPAGSTGTIRGVRVVAQADGRVFLVLQTDAATLKMYEFVGYTTGSVTLSGPTTIDTDMNANGRWDICAVGADKWAIAYYRTAAPSIGVKIMSGTTISLSVDHAATGAATPNYAIAVCQSSGATPTLLVAWASSTGGTDHVSSQNFVIASLATSGAECAHGTPFNDVTCSGSADSGTSSQVICFNTATFTGETRRVSSIGALGPYPKMFQARGLVSKPYPIPPGHASANGYCGTYFVVMGQRNTYYMIRIPSDGAASDPSGLLHTLYPVARFFDGNGPSDPDFPFFVNASCSISYSSGSLIVPLVVDEIAIGAQLVGAGLPQVITRTAIATAELTPSFANPIADLNGIAMMANGINNQHDGEFTYEQGFAERPTILSNTSAAAGGSLSDGTYSFIAVYAWIDLAGNLQLSELSDPYSITLAFGGAVQAVTLSVRSYWLSGRVVRDVTTRGIAPQNALIFLYRTQANGTLYYLNEIQPSVAGVAAVTFAPSYLLDTLLIANRILYTTGGALQNAAPPPATSLCSNGTRLFAYQAGKDTIHFSKKYTSGEAINFCRTFTKALIPDGSVKTTLAAMDGRIIALRENSIQYFDGDGPTENGANDTFSDVRIIPSEGGCIPNTPSVTTAMGVFYKSQDGIKLLTRGLEVIDIGAPVDDFASLTLRSIVHMPEENKVYFVHTSTPDIPGVFTYDYFTKQWSRLHWTIGASTTPIAARYRGVIHAAGFGASAVNTVKSGTTYQDQGSSYSMRLETPWVKLANLQGFQRLWYINVLGTIKSNHTLTLDIFKDYSETIDQTVAFAVTGSVDTPLQFRHHYGKKCQSVKFRLSDSSQSSSFESCVLTGISLEIGLKRGVFKLPATQTV